LHLIRSKMEDYTYYWLSEHGKYELERNQSYINLIINESNKNIDVHHNKYEGDITINDLELLCRSCHKKEHYRLKELDKSKIYTKLEEKK